MNKTLELKKKLEGLLDSSEGQTFDFRLKAFSEELIQNRQCIPPLFRYMPANYDNIRGLETQELFLSEIGSMNDIFEMMSAATTSDVINKLSTISDLFYIKSFTENPNDLLMWGIYADSFRGMCVEYDLRDMDETAYYYHLFPVIYKEKRYPHSWFNIYTIRNFEKCKNEQDFIDAEMLVDIYPAVICKADRWRDEKEWRIIVTYMQMKADKETGEIFDPDAFEEQYAINKQTIRFPYIKRVFIGPKMEERKRKHIEEIGKKNNFEVCNMELAETDYLLKQRRT